MNQRIKDKFRIRFSLPVTIPSLLILGFLLIVCTIYPKATVETLSQIQSWVTWHFDWFYSGAVTIFLFFLVYLASSKYGEIRLGPDDSKPDYNFVSWSAMLFAAGMGTGLMYFGIGEPLQHYLRPPLEESATIKAAQESLEVTFFHWGFHAWSVYGVVGLVLAYFGFRYNLPLTIRSGLYPLFQKRINGALGHSVDVFILVATIAGISTSLGFASQQLAAGLGQLTNLQTDTNGFRLTVIFIVIFLAGLSAISGLDKGVKRLSEFNLTLSILLLCFVLFCGPTLYLVQTFNENVGNYLNNLVKMSLRTFAYDGQEQRDWYAGWTLLYWAWWISWSPFVGMFIAKISRGRTVKEFIIGVLLVPSIFNLIWMTVFGNGAIWIDNNVANGTLSATASNVDALLFKFFEYLPLTSTISWLSILLISLFFITSADSGAFVVDSIATRGDTKAPVWQRMFWAIILGITAAILTFAGGLSALQKFTLIAALPVTFIMLLLCFGLLKGMKADLIHSKQNLSVASDFWIGLHWRKRLEQIIHTPNFEDVHKFIQKIVLPAMKEVALEFEQKGITANVREESKEGGDENRFDTGAVSLHIPAEGMRDFVYGVKPVKRLLSSFMLTAIAQEDGKKYVVEPITFFADGRQGYDIQYFRKEELITDILRNYERYLSLSANKSSQLLNLAPEHI